MEYLITIHLDESTAPDPADSPAPGTPEFNAHMEPWFALNQRLIDEGKFISAASLQPTSTATTVRREFGQAPTVTDGPFAETKESLGGFYLISADNLDQALEIARAIPAQAGSIEVRPVAFRPFAQ